MYKTDEIEPKKKNLVYWANKLEFWWNKQNKVGVFSVFFAKS